MPDQAEGLRRKVLATTTLTTNALTTNGLTTNAEQRGGVLVVIGAQPGVGASTVASQFAQCLYRRNRSVGLVQLPGANGNSDHFIAPTRHASLGFPSWSDVAQGHRTLREAWRQQDGGLPWIRAENEPTGACSRKGETGVIEEEVAGHPPCEKPCVLGPWGVKQMLLAAADRTVVIDAGFGPHLNRLLPAATHVCFVIDGNESRAADLYACLKHLSGSLGAARCWLVLNRVVNPASAALVHRRLVATADRFLNLAVGLAGLLPEYARPLGREAETGNDLTADLQEDWRGAEWREAIARMASLLEEDRRTRTGCASVAGPLVAA